MRNHLKKLRSEHRWSQIDLARRLGVSRQTVIAIETGRFDPSLPLAFRIARAFGRSIEKIFEPAVEMERMTLAMTERESGAEPAAEFEQGDGAR